MIHTLPVVALVDFHWGTCVCELIAIVRFALNASQSALPTTTQPSAVADLYQTTASGCAGPLAASAAAKQTTA